MGLEHALFKTRIMPFASSQSPEKENYGFIVVDELIYRQEAIV